MKLQVTLLLQHVTFTSPMNRGLKGLVQAYRRPASPVTFTSPMNRGLKDHLLLMTPARTLKLHLLPR